MYVCEGIDGPVPLNNSCNIRSCIENLDGWMDGWMDRYLIFDTKGKIYIESESEKISDFHQKINVKRTVQDV